MRYSDEHQKQMSFGNVVVLALFALMIWLLVLMSFMFGMRGHIQNFGLLAIAGVTSVFLFRFVCQYDRQGYWVAVTTSLVSLPAYLLFRSMIFNNAEAIFILVVIAISAQWGIGPGVLLAGLAWLGYGIINILLPSHPEPIVQMLMNGGFFVAAAIIVGALAQHRQSALIARAKMTEVLEKSYVGFLATMSLTLDARDSNTQGHSERVARLAQVIAQEMKLSSDALEQIRWGALLHDIGKIGIPDAILHKPGKLTAAEWRMMRQHPEIGYEMLRSIPFLNSALDVVRYHHERFDGGGYPAGLKGSGIPLLARISAVADSYDAITSHRPYRPGQLQADAISEIHKFAGTQFDPEVVAAFDRVIVSPKILHAAARAKSLRMGKYNQIE